MSFFLQLVRKLAFAALLLLSCSPLFAQGGGGKSRDAMRKANSDAIHKATDYRRWNGPWLLNCVYEHEAAVTVVMTGPETETPGMVAVFLDGDGDCQFGTGDKERGAFLWAKVDGVVRNNDDGKIIGITLHGKVSFCTTDKDLAAANNLTAVFECDFEGTFDPDTDIITGHAKSEKYYSPASKSSSKQYTRTPAEDPVISVILTLKDGNGVDKHSKLPDTNPNPTPTPTPDPRAAINKALQDWWDDLVNWDVARYKKNPQNR